ncbi:hypothetical protein [Nonomuraea sp. NPDC050691]|uniref:hypothetical protein n=1 Tax=Nonomuraea sp. NPDC050691 TaxID=3155661 RepID=UPI0034071B69
MNVSVTPFTKVSLVTSFINVFLVRVLAAAGSIAYVVLACMGVVHSWAGVAVRAELVCWVRVTVRTEMASVGVLVCVEVAFMGAACAKDASGVLVCVGGGSLGAAVAACD